ncbi:TatD family hydrolase [Muribaculum sp.]|jgi:TatD DNase family protein|uniref:TatD family hydrolase n=1 Tax=Muribaculum sp. TaxID=1918611 RepID=UPI00257AD782|nr:TatD family hydrolase [Muribaculum sp.]
MFVDTHTHPYLPDFENPESIIQNAVGNGVGHMILPAVDMSSIEPMLKLHAKFPEHTSLAFGLHPTEVGNNHAEVIEHMKNLSRQHNIIAVGEIGIDLYWDKSNLKAQREAFKQQIEWALEYDLPVIIHCRDGLTDTLDVLQHCPAIPRGVMHSFSGTPDDVELIRQTGDFYFGINGIVTFKNSHLRDSLQAIGLDRILLETDAPYLAPVPVRGKRCEPAYLVHTANHIARHMNITVEKLTEITTLNTNKLFRLNIV